MNERTDERADSLVDKDKSQTHEGRNKKEGKSEWMRAISSFSRLFSSSRTLMRLGRCNFSTGRKDFIDRLQEV